MQKKLFAILALAIAASTSPGHAQESVVERLLALSREANGECRKAQLPKPALDAACEAGRAYDSALGELGFCPDRTTGQWRGCAPSGPVTGSIAESPLAKAETGSGSAANSAPVEEYQLPPGSPGGELYGQQAEEQAEVSPEVPAGPDSLEGQGQPKGGGEDETAPDPMAEPEDVPSGREWARVETGEWRTYFNPRFGTTAAIPAWQFQPGTEIDEGGGQTFVAADGRSDIAVYGTLLEGQSFAEYRDWYHSELSGVSYEAGGRNWFVISGTAEGNIFYVKAVRSQRCGVEIAHHIVLRYPASLKRRFDPILERLAGSLRGNTPPAYCG